MCEYSEEDLNEMAYESWVAHFSKLPPVPYLEAALNAIVAAAAADNYRDDTIELLCADIALAARETALEGYGIDYLDNEIREVLQRKAQRPGWAFLKEHLREAAAEELRLEEDRMWGGEEENANDAR